MYMEFQKQMKRNVRRDKLTVHGLVQERQYKILPYSYL